MAEKIAYEIEIKNLKQVTKLKEELKKLRKQQKLIEGETKKGTSAGKNAAKQYDINAKAIGNKSKKLRDLNKELRTGTTATKKATKSNNSMAKQFIKGAAAIGIVVGAFRAVNRIVSSVVSTFSEFEFVMAKVNAVSGATEQEFAALTETAQELGRTTFFTAAQVGELMLNFSKLGFTAQEIQDAVQPTLDLATATGSDLARAATVAGAAVRGFGLDASETQRVVDVMAVSFSSSAMNIEKWQTSMTKVAPIAKAAGFSIEDTAAIMSKLTDSGIEASIAGTSLRNILLKMQDPTSELSMRFGRTIHSLDDLVPAMQKFVAEGGSMADIMEVVDLRQAAAFEQMITTADSTLALRDSLRDANGEGARMAEIVGDTLQGAFLKFTSALQGLSISVVEGFSQSLQGAVENAAKFFNTLAENSTTIVKSIKVITKLVKWIGLYKLGVIAANTITATYAKTQVILRWAMIKTTAATVSLTTAFTALRVAAKSAMSATGIGLILVGLSELIPLLTKTKEETEDVLDVTERVTKGYFDSIKPIEGLKTSSEQLVKIKERMNKLTDSEGKLLVNNAKNQKLYNTYKGQAALHMRTLNAELKNNDQAMITEASSIDDVRIATNKLIESMTQKALVKGYETEIEKIVQKNANATVMLHKIANELGLTVEETTGHLQGLAKEMSTGLYPDQSTIDNNNKVLMETFKILDLLSDTEFESVEELYEILANTDTDIQVATDAFDDLSGGIGKLIEKLDNARKKFKGGGADVTNWAKDMTEALTTIKKQRVANGISDVEFDKQMREKKLEILQGEYNDKATNEDRKVQLAARIADLQLQMQDKAFADLLAAKKEEYDKQVQITISQNSIEGQVTEEGNRLLLNLELNYLTAKGKLHADYKREILGNNAAILASSQRIHDQQMRMAREQVSAIGGVGGALQTLAGDNEEYNAIKEAGIYLSEAAAIADAAMTLQTHLQTLGIIQKNAAQTTEIALNTADAATTNVQTGSDIANTGATLTGTLATIGKTAVDIISIPFKATSAILTAGMSLPFPLNLVAFAATIFLVKKIMDMFSGGGIAGGSDAKLETQGEATTFAKGGMVRGKSHAQGGEKFGVGGRVMELEAGEAVINKRSTAMFKDQLSAMNAAGGGVKFADGGLLNMPSFATASFSALNSSQGTTQKVVVVESDITKTQRKVNVIEAAATI